MTNFRTNIRTRSPLFLGLSDLVAGAKRMELWVAFASEDIQKRYIRSGLGVLWIGISYALFLLVYVLIFGRLAADELPGRVCYIASGFLVWNFMSSAMGEGVNLFIGNANWIKAARMPYTVFAFQNTLRLSFHFAFAIVVTIAVVLWFRAAIHPHQTMLTLGSMLIALVLMVISAFWISIFFGIIALRYRDFVHFMNSALRIGFLVTPVLWEGGRLGRVGAIVATYNPITYYIELIRRPLLDGYVPWHAWGLVLGITTLGFVIAIGCLSIFYKKLVFWL